MSRKQSEGKSSAQSTPFEGYKVLFQSHPQPMWIYDLETLKFLAVNDAAVARYGYTEAEFLQMTIKEIRPEKDVPALLENIANVGEGLDEAGIWQHLKKDGSVIFVEISSHTMTFGGRKAELVMAHDVTARYREEEMRRRLQQAIINSRDVVFMTAPDGTITYVNPAFEALYGYSAREAIGKNPRILKSGKHSPEEYKEFYSKIRSGHTFRREIVNRTKDGRLVEVESAVDPIIDESQTVSGFIAIQRDISLRKEEKKQLDESVLRFRQLAENIQQVFWMTEPNKNEMLYVSPAYELIWGRTPYDLYRSPRSWMDAIHEDDRERVRQAAMTKQLDGTYNEIYRIVRPDGTIRWIRDQAFPVRNKEGNVYRVTGIAADITEYVAAERALNESEARFRTLAQTASAAIFTYAETFAYVNPAAELLTGYTADELLRMPFWEVVHPDHRELVRQRGEARLRGEHVPNRYEFKILRKDGAARWIEFSAGRFKPNGKAYAIGTAFDITERKQFEEQLRNSEKLYKDLVENSNEVSYLLDRNLSLSYISPVIERRTGFTPSELIGRQYAHLIHPDDVSAVMRTFREGVTTGQIEPVEFRFITKSGATLWVRSSVVPLLKEGRIESIRGVAIDITERKKAEDALRESEARYRNVFENDLTGDYISTPDGTILDCNPAFLRIFGFTSKEEALSTNAVNLHLTPKARGEFLELLRREKTLVSHECTMQRVDGTAVHVVENTSGIFDEHGELVEIRGYLFDDTKRKQLEKQLFQAQKLESIGTLAGGIAHDLNNILGPILLGSEILKRKVQDVGTLQLVNTIEKSAQRGAAVVRQILTFARGVDGERMLIHPKHILQEVMELMQETFPKSIHLEKRIPNDIWPLIGDPTQLLQVVLNLCVNARDAMPNGGTLTLKVENVVLDNVFASNHHQAPTGRSVRIVVTDTGVGMTPEMISKIFDPFFTTKEVGKGTGLGLSTALGIIKSHGGFINVYSEVGKGSSFMLYLPASEAEKTVHQETISTMSLFGKGEVVMLVDDESTLREMMRTALESYRYSVITAKDGAEAVSLATLHRKNIRVVITDIMMPYMDGAATMKVLRHIIPEAMLIATSGLQTNEQEALASGATSFLLKPFSSEQLLHTVRKQLDES